MKSGHERSGQIAVDALHALPQKHTPVQMVIDRLESRTLLSATRAVTPPTVTSFTLINADTNQPVVGMTALANGAVLNLSALSTAHLNVRANVTGRVGSVKFGYDGKSSFHIENGAPYALASNNGADYFSWTPTVGAHTLRGTAYTLANAAGTAGATLSVSFMVETISPPSPPPLSPPPPPPPSPPVSGDHHYLYAFDAPKDATGFFTLKQQIEVFDIDNGHQWVKNIPIPAKIYDIRGVAAVPSTGKLYVSYFLTPKIGYQPGGLLCMDLNTDQLLWQRNYSQTVVPAPDRFDITPNGQKIYMPSGEFGTSDFWTVIDANNGNPIGQVHFTTTAHNTIVSLDGTRAFLEGQEKQAEDPSLTHMLGVVDTATDQVIQKVGPFRDVIRPFTINGTGTLVFATVNNFIGFQIGSVTTGQVLYTEAPPGVPQPTKLSLNAHSHGIALSSDETKVFVDDTDHNEIHVWNVAGVADGIAPTYLGAIKVRKPGHNLAGQVDPAASNDASGLPSWLGESIDGQYIYAEGGEIVDTQTLKVVGQLQSKTTNSAGQLVLASYTHSRFYLEVDFQDGVAVRTGDQFGIGRVAG